LKIDSMATTPADILNLEITTGFNFE